MSASVEGFEAFFREVHSVGGERREPFRWQTDLLAEILDRRSWPATVDVPTGLGKTSLIDLSVYLAGTLGEDHAELSRRRTFFAIDRRVVVDEAYEHARQLGERLAQAKHGTALHLVAEGLRSRMAVVPRHDLASNAAQPLVASRMRGGITWSWRWLERPDQPAVIVGTVDQLGSRFLFRGYGVSPRLRPIDAALVGTDSLIIIDEAHIAQPFVETLRWAVDQDQGSLDLARPRIVTMSATQPMRSEAPTAWSFAADLERHRDGEAARRLDAAKELYAVTVPSRRDPSEALAGYGVGALDIDRGVKAVGIICNTVDRARRVVDEVRSKARALGDTDVEVNVRLLVGRVRPVDGERIRNEVWDDLKVGRDRVEARPTILVTTQTIEVGANLDFDALVTESAPLDALVQRLGRLNRLGRFEGASRDGDDAGAVSCVVVHHEDEQPLYGEARDKTWDWLATLVAPSKVSGRSLPPLEDGLPVSTRELRRRVEEIADVAALLVDPPRTPALFPQILDEWAMTYPAEASFADVAPFLHGRSEDTDDVSLVWRADLPASTTGWQEAVDRLPPVAAEQLSIPLRRFRRWLRGVAGAGEIADIPSVQIAEDESPDVAQEGVTDEFGLVWSGPEAGFVYSFRTLANRVRPGDVVVLRSSVGGCDDEGWAPDSDWTVTDVAEVADDRAIVRVHPRTLPTLIDRGRGPWAGLRPFAAGGGEQLEQLLEGAFLRLASCATDELDDETELVVAELRARGFWPEDLLVSRVVGEQPVVLGVRGVGRAVYARLSSRSGAANTSTNDARGYGSDGASDGDPGSSSIVHGQVLLEDHLAAVEQRARGFAKRLGISDLLQEAVAEAARAHDLGKWDPRFQTMLHGGDPAAADVAVADEAPLAKSGMDPADRRSVRAAFRASGLPRGYRHEVGSAQAVAGVAERLGADVQTELVQHLVASHHGYARPLFPAVSDEEGQPFRIVTSEDSVLADPTASVDFAHPDRFSTLSAAYGHWGLALLETIVRLADIGCSEEGS